jgi:hypothetical protein
MLKSLGVRAKLGLLVAVVVAAGFVAQSPAEAARFPGACRNACLNQFHNCNSLCDTGDCIDRCYSYLEQCLSGC